MEMACNRAVLTINTMACSSTACLRKEIDIPDAMRIRTMTNVSRLHMALIYVVANSILISNLSASMSLADCAPLFLLLLLHLAFARPLFPLPSKTKNEEKKPIQTFRPYNIAHRGSNGEIPEETAAAYLVLLRKLRALLICSRILYFYLAKGIRCFCEADAPKC